MLAMGHHRFYLWGNTSIQEIRTNLQKIFIQETTPQIQNRMYILWMLKQNFEDK